MKKHNELMGVSEFASLFRTTRQTLIFYDRIDLLKPARVLDNGYRLYSRSQGDTLVVINTLHELGMPLKEIRSHLSKRDVNSTLEIFETQKKVIEEKMLSLRRTQRMIEARVERMRRAKDFTASKIELTERSAVCMYETRFAPCRENDIPDSAWQEIFERRAIKVFSFGYPVGYIIDKNDFVSQKHLQISGIYYRLVENVNVKTDIMQAGTYLTATGKGTESEISVMLKKISLYLKENSLSAVSDLYFEWLSDETYERDESKFVFNISLRVERLN